MFPLRCLECGHEDHPWECALWLQYRESGLAQIAFDSNGQDFYPETVRELLAWCNGAAAEVIPLDPTLYDLIDRHVHENTRFHLVDWPNHRQLLKGLSRWREETTQRLARKNWAVAFELRRKVGAEQARDSDIRARHHKP